MTDPLDRIGAVPPTGDERRRGPNDRRERLKTQALVPLDIPEPTAPPPAEDRVAGPAEYAAQLLGQGARRRGLKGGQPVLDEARAAYLGAEYSGPADRRPKRGTVKREV